MFALSAFCALLLAVPGQTEVTKYVNDLLIFLDGAYRIGVGQVPNLHFHTALGPLAYYIPASGYWLTGNLGGAMPVGTALTLLLLAPVIAHIVASRFRPALGIPFAALLILVLAAPFNLGEAATALSFGMFYNRIGWAGLALLLVMYLPPQSASTRQTVLDTASAALLTVLLAYLKITYAVVAVAFLILVAVLSRQRRWAVAAMVATVATGLLVEAFWRGTAEHIADLRLAAEVGGGLRGSMDDRVRVLLANLPDYLVFALLAGLAWWRTRSARDLLFYGFCAAAGTALMNQNFQSSGMITLFAGGVVAAERLMSGDRRAAERADAPLRRAAPLVFLAFILPTAVSCALALGIHSVLAAQRAGEDFRLPGFAGVQLVNVFSSADWFFSINYLNTLRNGAAALTQLTPEEGAVFVVDFVSPFSAGLGRTPPVGDSSWQHIDRTFNDEHFLPPETLFRGVDVILDPKRPVERFTAEGLRRAYLSYIQENYNFVGENADWWVYRAKTG